MPASPFADLPVVGALTPDAAAHRLRALGATDAAAVLESAESGPAVTLGVPTWWPFSDKPWQHTAHVFGFLGAAPAGNTRLPIRGLGTIPADPTLRGARVDIRLNRLRVADYPGWGTHRVLLDFNAQNHLASGAEILHFAHTFRVREGERAAMVGYPIFTGLTVGPSGLDLGCYTVNVKNDEDEKLLAALDNDVLKAGLKLAQSAQPAIAPLSSIAYTLTRTLAARNRNVAVQDIRLGLDFSNDPMGARLAEGSYIAVQVPEKLHSVWTWEGWAFNPDSGMVEDDNSGDLIPYNYVVIGITRHAG